MNSASVLKRRLRFFALWFCAFMALASLGLKAADKPEVDVILWFDTEDYLLPASDDAGKRLAELLTERNIRATFKCVGEKARELERRGRCDVIAALQKHDIAYHSNLHSVHPTPSEYLADCGLLDGVAEFIRREGSGAADVRRIFDVPTLSCYGQPGASWGPQGVIALKEIGVASHGVPCYVDDGCHVGLNQKPFWYCGALNVFNFGKNFTRMNLHDPAAVEPAKQRVSAIVDRMQNEEGGGLISIGYHPCEWVHQKFWDAANFAHGANPPREQWKAPPQRTAEETEGAFRRFSEYIDYIRVIPGVRFVTACDLPCLYPDAMRQGTSEQDLQKLASHILDNAAHGVDFYVIENRAYSVADQFELLSLAVGALIDGKKLGFPLKTESILGPDAPPPSNSMSHLDWPAFRDAALDVRNFIQTQKRVPSRVFIGPDAMAPADMLTGLAAVYDFYVKHGRLPDQEGVNLATNVELLSAKNVAADTPEVFGRWAIHREGYRAPKILDLARLQAWTLKPALHAENTSTEATPKK
jgi:hypothetical protein